MNLTTGTHLRLNIRLQCLLHSLPTSSNIRTKNFRLIHDCHVWRHLLRTYVSPVTMYKIILRHTYIEAGPSSQEFTARDLIYGMIQHHNSRSLCWASRLVVTPRPDLFCLATVMILWNFRCVLNRVGYCYAWAALSCDPRGWPSIVPILGKRAAGGSLCSSSSSRCWYLSRRGHYICDYCWLWSSALGGDN